jgi:hypothetical protein
MAGRAARIYRAFANVWCVMSLQSSFPWYRPTPFIEDCAAFIVIVFSARERGFTFVSGVPTLLGNIVEGGTVYFLVVFTSQVFLIFCEILAPVSDLSTVSFSFHNDRTQKPVQIGR